MKIHLFTLTIVSLMTLVSCEDITVVNELPGPGFIITSIDPEIGGPGMTVEIEGLGFSSAAVENIVTFDGITAAVKAASPTRIITTVPEGVASGPVNVQVGEETAVGPVFTLDDRLVFVGKYITQGFEVVVTEKLNGNVITDTTFNIDGGSEINIILMENSSVDMEVKVKQLVEDTFKPFSSQSSFSLSFVFKDSPVARVVGDGLELDDINFELSDGINAVLGEFSGEGTLTGEGVVLFRFSYKIGFGNSEFIFSGEVILQKQYSA